MASLEVTFCGLWFTEKICRDYTHSFRVEEILYRKKSKYQLIEVVKHTVFGKILFLDGKPQVSEYDEWIYHECLVHPVLLLHPQPESVLILGGGDGGALREVLKHKAVKRVVLVDLDPDVIETIKKYIPEIPKGAFEDKRVGIRFMDGREYVRKTNEQFDVIIVDVTDPFSGISASLFTKEFYMECKQKLKSPGILVTQAESPQFSHLYFPINYATIVKTLESVFKYVSPFLTFVPSFASDWGFVMASEELNPKLLQTKEVKEKLSLIETRFIDKDYLDKLLILPKNIKELISKEGKVITDEDYEECVEKLRKTAEELSKAWFLIS